MDSGHLMLLLIRARHLLTNTPSQNSYHRTYIRRALQIHTRRNNAMGRRRRRGMRYAMR